MGGIQWGGLLVIAGDSQGLCGFWEVGTFDHIIFRKNPQRLCFSESFPPPFVRSICFLLTSRLLYILPICPFFFAYSLFQFFILVDRPFLPLPIYFFVIFSLVDPFLLYKFFFCYPRFLVFSPAFLPPFLTSAFNKLFYFPMLSAH